MMHKERFQKLCAVGLLVFGSAIMSVESSAAVINITPSTPGIILGSSLTPPTGANNCEAECVYKAFGLTYPVPSDEDPLTLLYKADVGDEDDPTTVYSGSFASSYKTTFDNAPLDPADALIEYVSGAKIACPECYMAIKDGQTSPTYYFINLGNLDLDGPGGDDPFAWNGMDSLSLTGFWPSQGAISHVSIWGRDGGGGGDEVPEPASLALVGLALAGLALTRRKRINA